MKFLELHSGATKVTLDAPHVPAPRVRPFVSDGRTYRAVPFGETDLLGTAPTLRVPLGRAAR